ncbi:MAG: RimK family alpha-L-glutamate ligase [Clostridia bacterium]|nr:RimK family alpha-L-glutamate ligase [Clostridia bacterium]
MQGLILINAYPNGEKFIRQGERIAEALRSLGVKADVKRNGEVYALVDEHGERKTNVQGYDFVVYLDKDKYLGKTLEESGIRLFNSARAVEICDDKMLTYLALKNAGVRLIKTIAAPLCYTPNAVVEEKFLNFVASELGFPLVVKKSYGSFGAGVQLVHGMPELRLAAQNCLYEPHFFQQYISASAGKDIRVIVVGGKAIAAMERVAQKGEFRSNIELGGVGKNITLTEEYRTAAERAATSLRLDYCGVDLLETDEGPILCEVNSNAFFEGLEKTTGVNVAAAYAEHIVVSVSQQK